MQTRTPSPGATPGSPAYCRPSRRRLGPLLAPALLAAALGCSEDAESPTAPEAAGPAIAATAALSFRQVSAGGNHTCAVTTDDRAYCWGENTWGQLGDDAPGFARLAPVRVLGGLRFRHVSAGFDHTCGVTTDDRAFCWGVNQAGQLGDGTSASRPTPVAVAAAGRRFRQVRAGSAHTCALTDSDVAFCWGNNLYNQLGDGTTTNRPLPVRVLGGLHWSLLNGGNRHTCGVTTENRAYCWGSNMEPEGTGGQLGDGTTIDRPRPVAVSGGLLIRQIDASIGVGHSCAVTTANRAYCWGTGFSGQLGGGTATMELVPVAVAGSRRFDHVSTGGNHSCGVTMAGRGFCWGWNGVGQVGDGTTMTRMRPVLVGDGLSFVQVSAGYTHTCALTTGGLAYCWGKNNSGQLGDGTTTNRPTPGAVAAAM
jgi:alpha-tubulin suppressor-like RCC1 family protein